MKPYRVYLDTSIINFVYADDAPEKKEATIDFFENYVRRGFYATYVSYVVFTEINNTKNINKRNRLLSVIERYDVADVDIQISDDIRLLSSAYIKEGIVPRNKEADALHIAIAVVNVMDVLLSWNYQHLANIHRERKIIGLNNLLGFSHNFRIITPLELLDKNYET
ncbi:MAG: hypothetical protein HYZ34_05640 [Ignavibacteriae bacterium]|nr:hypothetical protein [Ignavibacteriota bacterium]